MLLSIKLFIINTIYYYYYLLLSYLDEKMFRTQQLPQELTGGLTVLLLQYFFVGVIKFIVMQSNYYIIYLT